MKVRLLVNEKNPTSTVLLADIDAAVERALDRANSDTLPVNIHLLREIVGVGASAPSGSGNSGNSGSAARLRAPERTKNPS